MSRYEKFKFYHKSFLKKNISENDIMSLSEKFSNIVIDKVISAPYTPGVLEYIKKSYERYRLFISTATPTGEINKILEARAIKKYFTGIYGSPDKKTLHINNILTKYNYLPHQLIFYGDSNSDLQAAVNTNVPFILVLNKFNKEISTIYNGKKIMNFIGL